MGESVRGRHVWYNLKFDRRLLMPFEKDKDVMKSVRGNDEHAYLYIAGKEGPRARPLRGSQQVAGADGGAAVAAVGTVGEVGVWGMKLVRGNDALVQSAQ